MRWLAVVTVVGLAVRIAYVVIRRDHPLGGDPFFYHEAANVLTDGGGFVQPFLLRIHATVEAADHPPLYLLFLAVPSLVGLDTALAHMLWSAALGTGTVVLTGLLGRHVGGPRVGLVAAAVAAVYPGVWAWDAMLLSETLSLFLATLCLLLAYRALEQTSVGRVLAVGATCGAAALARSELILLVPALLLPVAIVPPSVDWGARLRRLAAGVAAAVVLMAPWVVFNVTRFEHPVLLSSQLEPTLAGANCRDTYSGHAFGYLTNTCLEGIDATVDQSVNASDAAPAHRTVRARQPRPRPCRRGGAPRTGRRRVPTGSTDRLRRAVRGARA